MTRVPKMPTPLPPNSSHMGEMGQVVPPIPRQAILNAVYLSLGAVAFSLGLLLLLRGNKKDV